MQGTQAVQQLATATLVQLLATNNSKACLPGIISGGKLLRFIFLVLHRIYFYP